MTPSEECVRKLSVEIPWDVVEKERERIVADFARDTAIPGFRKGKAPRKILYRHYEDDISSGLLKGIVWDALLKQIKERAYNVATNPELISFTFTEGQPLVAEASLEIFQDFELKDYKNIEVHYRVPETSEEAVQERLEALRKNNATFQNIDPRPVQDGDFVNVELDGFSTIDDKLIVSGMENLVEVGGEGVLPGFNKALIGKNPGDKTEFVIDYPDDFTSVQIDPDDTLELAGKSVRFKGEIKDIKKKELPELDDEFAKDIDKDLGSLDDLRKKVHETLQENALRMNQHSARLEILRKLLEMHPVILPEKCVRNRMEYLQQKQQSRPEEGVLSAEEFRTDAEALIQIGQILDRIVEIENIEVTTEEINYLIEDFAKEHDLTAITARKFMIERGILQENVKQAAQEKVIQLIFDKASKIEPPEQIKMENPEEAHTDTQSG